MIKYSYGHIWFTGSIVLRVPLLYGPVERINESGGTYLYNYVIQSSHVKHVCNYQQRFPTHIQDVSSVLRQMADKLYKVGELDLD